MLYRISACVMALVAALLLAVVAAPAFDDFDLSGIQRPMAACARGGHRLGRDQAARACAQNPPLTAEYQAIWEASMADQAAGGQGNDTRVTCVSNGMPRLMTIIRPMEFFIYPWITWWSTRTTCRAASIRTAATFPKDEEPSYAGYSIGKWLDTDWRRHATTRSKSRPAISRGRAITRTAACRCISTTSRSSRSGCSRQGQSRHHAQRDHHL